ncbi:hypothetical protein [Loigolactobacillus zhaoyuanensis]|uniref:Small secreted protein n=1 Tax=Loigolactobacillus zhaoyuanensis TaxID=2486017 RepID=A0ABW8U884_9LACO|nr:hypothetical protein [Loigolactobacillus zhaoyuanensis]
MNKTTRQLASGSLLLISGLLLSRRLWRNYRGAQPDKLLQQLKQKLQQQAPISGTWIELTPLHYHNRLAYRGGVTQQLTDHRREYRFIIAANGQLLAGHWQPLND